MAFFGLDKNVIYCPVVPLKCSNETEKLMSAQKSLQKTKAWWIKTTPTMWWDPSKKKICVQSKITKIWFARKKTIDDVNKRTTKMHYWTLRTKLLWRQKWDIFCDLHKLTKNWQTHLNGINILNTVKLGSNEHLVIRNINFPMFLSQILISYTNLPERSPIVTNSNIAVPEQFVIV